jgi:hypothetical protein
MEDTVRYRVPVLYTNLSVLSVNPRSKIKHAAYMVWKCEIPCTCITHAACTLFKCGMPRICYVIQEYCTSDFK